MHLPLSCDFIEVYTQLFIGIIGPSSESDSHIQDAVERMGPGRASTCWGYGYVELQASVFGSIADSKTMLHCFLACTLHHI